ncbi:type II toxin-antitoxin system HicB family antitoxin [Colwelliaceae bacterium 6471]
MNYPILISKNALESDYKLSVPDLPGCQLKAPSISKAMESVDEAIASHLSILAEYGENIPSAKPIEFHMENCSEENPIWALVNFDILPYLGKSHKINVTLPELLIKQIDDRVNISADHKTRSGFIASACLKELNKR